VEQHDWGPKEEFGQSSLDSGPVAIAVLCAASTAGRLLLRGALQYRNHPFDNIIDRHARRKVGLLIGIFHPIAVSMRSMPDDLVLPVFFL
jgi:hypothetical protein